MLAKPRKTQWFCWSLSRHEKWLFHWGYTLFSDIPLSSASTSQHFWAVKGGTMEPKPASFPIQDTLLPSFLWIDNNLRSSFCREGYVVEHWNIFLWNLRHTHKHIYIYIYYGYIYILWVYIYILWVYIYMYIYIYTHYGYIYIFMYIYIIYIYIYIYLVLYGYVWDTPGTGFWSRPPAIHHLLELKFLWVSLGLYLPPIYTRIYRIYIIYIYIYVYSSQMFTSLYIYIIHYHYIYIYIYLYVFITELKNITDR